MENTYSRTKTKTPEFINKLMDKGAIRKLLSQMYLEYGGAKTGELANTLKNLGYKYATRSGVTISISDLSVPETKKELLASAEEEIEKSTNRYLKGEITEVERYTKVIDTWSETTAKLTEQVVENFDRLNPVYMMAFSGARGNLSQVSQLVGMRGLMADAAGQIIDLPIKSNFKEGLSVTEYIISSYGARKGLVDTALKTADSGYLTRRLVDVAQDVIVREHDCGGDNYINMTSIVDGDNVIVPLIDRLLGRTVAEDIFDTDGKTLLVAKDTTMSREDVEKISHLKLESLKVRSGLTCSLEYGVCQKCYGWALTTQKLVDIGEAIGIIAAQSIGEPGTQLTLRTFHTGGAVGVKEAKKETRSREDGVVSSSIKTREQRTRHGDVFNIAINEADIEVKGEKRTNKYHVLAGSVVFVKDGDSVKKGDLLAEFDPASQHDSGRLTETAYMDINSDVAGQVFFDGFDVDEKKDRQGNISRTANKAGIVWVVSGDVYNLPGGSSVSVKDNQKVKAGDELAKAEIICEHGGEVRYSSDLVVEDAKFQGKNIKKIVKGKELTIVIASLIPSNATFEQTKKEQFWTVGDDEEKYIVKAPVDTTVENGMVIAELVDDEYSVSSSGEIKYIDVEVDENQVITKAGEIVFIPEEVHQLNKDSSLKMVENGTLVTEGTEIVKDVYSHIDGVVEFNEFNDVIHEITIRPGEVYTLASANDLKVEENTVIKKGTVIAEGVKAKQTSIVTIMESAFNDIYEDDLEEEIDTTVELEEKPVQILVRPVQVLKVKPKDVSIRFDSSDDLISIVSETQLQYKDGARVRNLDGATLTRTSLKLMMEGYLSHLKGLIELDSNGQLKVVVLETLIVRRELEGNSKLNDSLQTELLVKDGDVIEPKTAVAKTEVLALSDGIASITGNEEESRRLLLQSSEYETEIAIKGKANFKAGDFIKKDEVVADSGEVAEVSGHVIDVTKKGILVRTGRPYLISQGTQLQTKGNSLLQRGDSLATLRYERQKTGDIVQGLPRVEELLEARKPKDSAILAEYDGVAIIEIEDETPRLFLESEEMGRKEIKFNVDSRIIVSNKQKVSKGDALTSGPLNPHDIIRLKGPEAAQQYLVDEVQRVYRSQGVEIADKHIEMIVGQMTKKVEITESGDTNFLPGEKVEVHVFNKTNDEVVEKGGQPAQCEYLLLGITKASLNTESFISAASFQETTRILTEAAVDGKKDLLRGLKENVIIGRLIPAGTGYHHLSFASEEKDREAQRRAAAQRNQARKPSAILEEIEGMFGSPDLLIKGDE